MSKPLFIVLLGLAITTLLTAPLCGISFISPFDIARSDTIRAHLLELRMPRTLTAFAVGSILALSGLIYQSALQNPLASPFTLGVSSAAALGASIATWLNFRMHFFHILNNNFFSSQSMFAVVFGMLLLFGLFSLIRKNISRLKLILFGVLASYFLNSLLVLIQYFYDYAELLEMTRWLMGSVVQYNLNVAIGLVCISIALFMFARRFASTLDLLALGETLAVSRGLNVEQALRRTMLVSSFCIALCVAVCGPIGFIGIIIPHVSRTLVGFHHRYTTVTSWVLGGVLLVLADVFARVLIPPFELPVGLITALLGAPCFACILLRRNYARTSRS